MEALIVTTIIVFCIGAVATVLNAIRASRAQARRWHYGMQALIAAYATAVYGLALVGVLDLRAIGPDWLRPAMILILGGYVATAIAHWRS